MVSALEVLGTELGGCEGNEHVGPQANVLCVAVFNVPAGRDVD